MNNNINQNIKNLIMIFAGYKEQMNGFFKDESRPDETCENSFEFCRFFLQRNFVTPQNVKFYNSPSDVSLGIEKEFISCFRKIPNSLIAQFNAELCNKLFEAILTEQEEKLSWHCTAGELEKIYRRRCYNSNQRIHQKKSYTKQSECQKCKHKYWFRVHMLERSWNNLEYTGSTPVSPVREESGAKSTPQWFRQEK